MWCPQCAGPGHGGAHLARRHVLAALVLAARRCWGWAAASLWRQVGAHVLLTPSAVVLAGVFGCALGALLIPPSPSSRSAPPRRPAAASSAHLHRDQRGRRPAAAARRRPLDAFGVGRIVAGLVPCWCSAPCCSGRAPGTAWPSSTSSRPPGQRLGLPNRRRLQRRRRGIHGTVAAATKRRARPRRGEWRAQCCPTEPARHVEKDPKAMRAIVTCECCGHRQTVARPIRRPESFYLVCTSASAPSAST